jgi:hypothetical protein
MVIEVTLIGGLPGSGKTLYMKSLQRAGWKVFDDFKANAYNHSSVFFHSRSYEALIKALWDGERCVVADIDFCKDDSRSEAELALRNQLPDLKLSWLFFARDFHACELNIKRRASVSIDDNLRALDVYNVHYRIPTGATVMPIWGPGNNT